MKNEWIDLVISWLPFLVLMAVWLLFASRKATGNVSTMTALHERQIGESQRTNALLERIAVSLEKRAAE